MAVTRQKLQMDGCHHVRIKCSLDWYCTLTLLLLSLQLPSSLSFKWCDVTRRVSVALTVSDQKDVWNLLQRCTFNLSQQKMHLKAIYKMYTCQISHLYRFLWLFLRLYHMASNAKKKQLGNSNITDTTFTFFVFFANTRSHTSTQLNLLWLAGLVAHSVNTEEESFTEVLKKCSLLIFSFCWCLYACLCLRLCCNYSKLQKYVTDPNECLHFLQVELDGWRSIFILFFCICCACIVWIFPATV